MTSMTERERRLVESVASDYQRRGYSVKLQPVAGDMPDFLSGFQPDLIATRADESIVVEIKHRTELRNGQSDAEIEAALRNHPGWRFELVIDGSKSEPPRSLGSSEILTSIEEANDLRQSGHYVAALLLLWSATESILRLIAARENIELESAAPGYITTQLYTLGLLEREQYRVLDEAVHQRNRAAHGFQTSITQQDLANISAVARQLLSELESKAA